MNAPLHAEDTAEVFAPSPELSRRMLLGSGAGLVLALSLPGTASAADEPKYGADSQPGGARDDPRLFVQLAPDGGITIICHRAEMGQGIRSSMAMIILDEMGADWNRLSIRQAEGDEARYGNQNTDGSRSIRHWLTPLRRCGAAMRMMLVQVASTRLGAPVAELEARDHKVVHARSGRSIAFGDLAEQRAETDGLAVLGDDFSQNARDRRRDFDGHLVGFQLDEGLVGLDGVTDLLEPGANSGFADGFAEGGYADFSGHDLNSVGQRTFRSARE